MAVSDLSRAKQHDPDYSWPTEVKVQIIWLINGHPHVRSNYISAEQFFGFGQYGAPMEGAALVGMINNMRREGPPPVKRMVRGYSKKKPKR
jgi:hypothetical protein